jgi:hypothetical protein
MYVCYDGIEVFEIGLFLEKSNTKILMLRNLTITEHEKKICSILISFRFLLYTLHYVCKVCITTSMYVAAM